MQFIDIDEFEIKVDQSLANSLKDDLDIDFYGDADYSDDELADFSDDLSLN